MHSKLVAVLAAFLAPFLVAGVAAAADVGSKHDADADFDGYRTYRWTPQERSTFPILEPGGELDTAIRAEVDERLGKVGLEKVADDAEADLLVSYDAAAVSAMDSDMVRREVTQGVSWVVEGSIRSYVDSTLVVTLTDGSTEEPVWSGWSGQRLVVDDRIVGKATKATRKIMRRYPPK